MLVDQLLKQNRLQPRSPAVSDPVSSLTYRNLTSLAVVMRQLVLHETRRDTVGILLPSGGAFAGSFFGTLWAGKVAVPLNFLLSTEELADIVRDAELDLILSVHHFDKATSQLPAQTLCLEDLPIKRRVFAARFRRRPPAPAVQPDDLAVLLYTSGTSGAPKGVELSFNNLRSNCDAIIEAVRLRDHDRFLCVLPPFHVFGLTANVLVPVLRGLAVRAIPRFNPAAVFRAITEFQPTVLMAIPSMYAALLRNKSADPNTFRGFHLLVSGGEPLPDVVADAFRERFSVDLLEGYGLTETSPVISIDLPRDHRRGAVGKPLTNLQLRIVTEEGHIAAANEEGEILVRGPSVMRGYHNRPEETAAVLDPDGWFATGDIGKLDHDGFLHITGRKKEMIIVGGENVFPQEIENVLSRHPAVEEAAVIGMPDPSRGEVPLAFLTLKGNVSATDIELRSFAKQHLAGYKVPREIRIVDDLPRGPTGKVAKRKLKERTTAAH
ncbi:MAG: AMP-binding protein [Phycisphaerae bacterium]